MRTLLFVHTWISLVQWFSTRGPGISSISRHGDLLEMDILRPRPRPTESETGMKVEPSTLISFLGDSDAPKCEMPGCDV